MDSSSSWIRRIFWKNSEPVVDPMRVEEGAILQEYGVTEQLRDFVKGFTLETFKDFPLPTSRDPADDDDHPRITPIIEDSPATASDTNVRQDLTEWQEQHATLVLSTVKEISQLRYVLCPRHLKERQFWRIYFMLVKSYVTPYEIRALHKAKLKMMGKEDDKAMGQSAFEVEMTETTQVTSVLPPASSELDLDTLPLGDPGRRDPSTDKAAEAGGSGDDNLGNFVAE
ncbi:BSD domain-containing protein [Tasmannia lanceolata]|uniref:BSD domain-containing protein n=1 Tax=Tasmannia lanceolata TaxID=3420 RepID=UPI004063A499